MIADDKNGFLRTRLTNHEETIGSNGFFSGTEGGTSKSSWIDEEAKGVVWSASGISRRNSQAVWVREKELQTVR